MFTSAFLVPRAEFGTQYVLNTYLLITGVPEQTYEGRSACVYSIIVTLHPRDVITSPG